MSIVTKPDMTNAWGEAGSVALPSPSTIQLGWEAGDVPPAEVENYIQYRQDQVAKYLYQEGIAEWDTSVEFTVGALTKLDGNVYRALIQNINKQPDTEDSFWELAFDEYGSAQDVQDALDELIAADDPFDQYALRTDPVIIGRTTSDGFSADVGLPTNNNSEVGYAFDGDTGLFKAGDDVVIAVDAVEKLRVKKATVDVLDNSKAAVTTEWIRNFMQNVLYRVGKLEFTTENVSPATYLGFGTWVRFGQGRAVVGYSGSSSGSVPDKYKTSENEFGSDNVTLSVENLPSHNHIMGLIATGGALDVGGADARSFSSLSTETNYETKYTGSGTPFDVCQPSIVVYIWKRTA